MKLKKIPHFNTPEEEDEFWQTHSPLDFEHEPVDRTNRPKRYFFPLDPSSPDEERVRLAKGSEE